MGYGDRAAARADCTLFNRVSAAALALALATGAAAQTQTPAPPAGPTGAQSDAATGEEAASAEIVVTGSLIRGVAPVGTNVTGVSAADIAKSGAISTNQVLSQIPAVTNAFNVVPVTPASLGRSTFRPDLRNLGATGSATTLVLVDGHNIVGAGVLQTTPDAGIIPPGALERVEVVADGGSSIYGSDAIGGIINFITRTRFDGFEVSGHAGAAKQYKAGDLNLTAGKAWDTGSIVVSLSGRANSQLGNEDRQRPRQDLRPFGGNNFSVRTCPIGTVSANGTTYALPTRTPGTVNLCDTQLRGVTAPHENQYSGFAALTQDIAPNLQFQVKGILSQRKTRVRQTQISNGAAVINATNPFYQQIGTETQQSVAFDYSAALGPYVYSRSKLTQYDVTPTLTWKLDNGLRVQALYQNGWSETEVHVPGINSVAEAAALRGAGLTTATALNPYNTVATNPSVLAAISNFENYALAKQSLNTARLSLDGALFHMPGGDVRFAVGGQWQRQHINALNVNAPRGDRTGAVQKSVGRTVKALYGELLVPIFGPDNAIPLFRSLTIDLSARYDDYSDVGSTTNPKIGATWEMAKGLKLRGNYGTAFNAPSLADSRGAVDTRANIVAPTTNIRPGDAISNQARPTIQLAGGNPSLQPQEASTWSIGGDYAPAFLDGLDLSLTYWRVKITKTIGGIPNTADLYNFPVYSNYFIVNPTLAQAQALTAGQLVTGAASIASLYGAGNDPYIIINLTRQNLGTLWVRGLDARIAYRYTTDWGQVYGSLNGTKQVHRKSRPIAGAPIVDQLIANRPKGQFTANLGADIGKFGASATMNYTGSFAVTGVTGQTKVKSFNPVNLLFRYTLNDNVDITLNVDNVADVKPPFVNLNGGTPTLTGFQVASTLGRFFNLGARIKF